MPLLFLPGTSGSFIAPVAAVVIMVLTLSLVEAFFVLPQHLAHLRPGPPRRLSPRRVTDRLREIVGGRIDRFADGRLRRMVGVSVAYPVATMVLAAGLLLASLALVTNGVVRFVFFPAIEGNFIAASLEMPEGTAAARTLSVAESIASAVEPAAERLAARVQARPEEIVEAVAITVATAPSEGGPDEGGGSQPSHVATIEVKVQDAEARASAASNFSDLWREEVGEIAGVRTLTFSG